MEYSLESRLAIWLNIVVFSASSNMIFSIANCLNTDIGNISILHSLSNIQKCPANRIVRDFCIDLDIKKKSECITYDDKVRISTLWQRYKDSNLK